LLSLTLILFFILLIHLIQFHTRKVSKRINQWRSSLNLTVHDAYFQKLYEEVDGFALSKRSRLEKDAVEWVYGEIDFESFIALLSHCKPNANTVFYDLGSGVGKAVLACAMVFNVKKSCGIEWFENLHQCAEHQRKRLSELPNYHQKSKTICFQQGNFLEASLLDANLVFINASCFFGDFWMKLSQQLEQLPQDTLVLSTSKRLQSKAYKHLETIPIRMSWGIVNVYVQQRIF
jgi:hypothetical protein